MCQEQPKTSGVSLALVFVGGAFWQKHLQCNLKEPFTSPEVIRLSSASSQKKLVWLYSYYCDVKQHDFVFHIDITLKHTATEKPALY